jgi:hypothetical protein
MATNKKQFNQVKFIEVDLIRRRFPFVKNEILKENIAINMQYVAFLYSLDDEYELPGAVRYSVFQTIVLFTASIIESLINYKPRELKEEGRIKNDDIMKVEDKYTHIVDIYKVSVDEKICAARKKKKYRKLEDDTTFNDLNYAAKKCKLFDKDMFEKAEMLRSMRNKIHLTALSKEEDEYTRKDMDNVFGIAKDIIQSIQNY